MDPRIRFLIALGSAVKNGAVKTIKQAMAFAKREFGEIDKDFTSKIINVFKKEGKTKKGDVVPIKKKEGILATDEATKIAKKRTDDIAMGDPTGEVSEIMEGLGSLKNIKQGGKGLNPREGVVRAAAREILNKNKIKIGKEDPIDLLRKTYGEAGLDAVDAIGDDLLNTQTYGEMNDLLTKNKLFNLKAKKVPGYDKSIQDAEELRMLDDFDIDPDRQPNAYGGIAGTLRLNREGYFAGKIVKGYQAGKAFWKLLKDPKKIRAAIDDIFPTGDYKLDAEMAVESLVELNPKVFGGKLADDLDDALRSEIYGAVIGPIQQNALKVSRMKKASNPTKTLEGIEKTGTINISDPNVADEFSRFMKETDPKGFKDLEQKVELSNLDIKGKKGHAEGGRVGMAKGGLPNILKL
mgnify:CR=1 FL=1